MIFVGSYQEMIGHLFLSSFLLLQSFQLQLQPPSGNIIPPSYSGNVVQIVNVANPQKVGITWP